MQGQSLAPSVDIMLIGKSVECCAESGRRAEATEAEGAESPGARSHESEVLGMQCHGGLHTFISH